ncbi:restriction endonuclease subunit S [Actinomadura flavalba]|uniref:restriction endonuclease subunit S n=1 Tax=Actinomadura flavalba TaxID=1120938 RepID=UPI0009DC42D2|nr:restriction endonuclease subunit S [Actinomadura flavalba]
MPENFPEVPLGELAELRIGATPSRNEPSFWSNGGEGLPWAAISDIKEKYLHGTSEQITQAGVKAARMRPVPAGTPIMSFKLSVGRACIPTIDLFTNEAIVSITPIKGLSTASWLYHAVPRIAERAVTETAVKGKTLNSKKLRELAIPTPASLEEQQHIAAIIDTLDELITKGREVVEKLDKVNTGISMDLINDLLKFPYVTLEKASSAPICYGIVQTGESIQGGVPVIMIRDLAEGFSWPTHHVHGSLDDQYHRSRVIAGDLILSIKATIGKSAIVPEGFFGNISRDVARIRLHENIIPQYLQWILSSPWGQDLLEQTVVGTTRAEVSIASLKKIKVPLPPPSEQKRVTAVIDNCQAEILERKRELRKLQKLKAGLVDDLLTGRVRSSKYLASKI